jgi:hypothetical protein
MRFGFRGCHASCAIHSCGSTSIGENTQETA